MWVLVIKFKTAQPSQISLLQIFLKQYYGDAGVHKISFSLNSWTQWSISLLFQKMLFFYLARVGNTHAFITWWQQSLIFLSYHAHKGFVTPRADHGLHFAPFLTSVEELEHPLQGHFLCSFLDFLSLKIHSKILNAAIGSLRPLFETVIKTYTI